jgi:hypothetical protein
MVTRYRVIRVLCATIGGALLCVGAFLPWLTIFAGLIGYPGVAGFNGKVLAGAGAAAVVAGLIHAATGRLRWPLGLIGLGAIAFCIYLVAQLTTTLHGLAVDPMVLANGGPGLYVCEAGALLVFATLFLPDGTEGGERHALRDVAVLGLVTVALLHIPVASMHLHEVPYLGWLFLGLAMACLAGAVLLANTNALVVWAAAGGICLLALAGYLVSRSIGLPLAGDDIGDWANPLGLAAVVAEAVVVCSAVTVLTSMIKNERRGRPASGRPLLQCDACLTSRAGCLHQGSAPRS